MAPGDNSKIYTFHIAKSAVYTFYRLQQYRLHIAQITTVQTTHFTDTTVQSTPFTDTPMHLTRFSDITVLSNTSVDANTTVQSTHFTNTTVQSNFNSTAYTSYR